MLPDDVTARMLRQLKQKHPLQQDDAIEDALMEAVESPAAKKDDVLQEGLVFKIAHDKLSNAWRQDRKFVGLSDGELTLNAKARLAGSIGVEDEIDCASILNSLEEPNRTIIEMRINGSSFSEIGMHLGMKEKTVQKRYERAIADLKKKMKK